MKTQLWLILMYCLALSNHAIGQSSMSCWSPLSSELSYAGICQALLPDGQGGVYVGGKFSYCDTINAISIAHWSDGNWQKLDSGLSRTAQINQTYALTKGPDGTLYAGGTFSLIDSSQHSYHVVWWNDTIWQPVPGAPDGFIHDVAFGPDSALYVAGQMNLIGTTNQASVARWNGESWEAVGEKLPDICEAMAWGPTGDLYVAGQFTGISGQAPSGVARWDGQQWQPVGNGLHACYDLAIDSLGTLYAATESQKLFDPRPGSVARWDGQHWTALDTSLRGEMRTLALDSHGRLYFAGNPKRILQSHIDQYGCLFRWDGQQSDRLITQSDGLVSAIYVDQHDRLLVGGDFVELDDQLAKGLATYEQNTWIPWQGGLTLPEAVVCRDMVLDQQGRLLVTGRFNMAGEQSANNIARWDGSSWQSLGGISGIANCVLVSPNGTIYVGGSLYHRDDFHPWTYGALRYLEGKWQKIGDQVRERGMNMVQDNAGNIYLAAWGGGHSRVLKLSGEEDDSWEPMGVNLDGIVWSLSFGPDSQLLAGGSFASIDQGPGSSVAVWNGQQWSAFDPDLQGRVDDIAWRQDAGLYLTGNLTINGDSSLATVVRWEGGRAQPILTDAPVNDLAFGDDGRLYAAGPGRFELPNLSAGVGVWDGQSWQAIGEGIWGSDRAEVILPTSDQGIFIGGSLRRVGWGTVNGLANYTTNLTSTLDVTLDTLSNSLVAAPQADRYHWFRCVDDSLVFLEWSLNQGYVPQESGYFAVEASMDGCVDTSRCVFFEQQITVPPLPPTGEQSLYPNPTTGNVTIDLGQEFQQAMIEVYDSRGQGIERYTYQDQRFCQLKVPGPAGFYYLKIIQTQPRRDDIHEGWLLLKRP